MSDDLEALAELFGVQVAYADVAGREHRASPETLAAVLEVLGADVRDPEGSARAERLRRHRLVVEPVVAMRTGVVAAVPVVLPRTVHPRDCWLTLTGESGRLLRTRLMGAIHRPSGSVNLEGVAVERYEATVAPAGGRLDPGYYRLRVEGPGIEASSLVVLAPRCPVPARGWGAFLPLYALRTGGDLGVGNYPALGALARWLRSLGAGLVGTLPLYPAFLDRPVEESPYRPVTRLGWNELYVDPTVLPEFESSPDARSTLGSGAVQDELDALRRSATVDYARSAWVLRRVLEPLARNLAGMTPERRSALEEFARARPDVVAYARFRAGMGFPAPGTPDAGGTVLAETLADAEARYHLYAQWAAHEQVGTVGEGLLLDLPVGTHPEGFDTAYEPDAFAAAVECGAPPDPFFAGGQRWGFRPLHPRALRAQNYRHLVAVLRHAMSRASVLRVDHVMGLARLWWIPDGAGAKEGAYVRYPADELRALVCLEAHRSATAVVGEDLGTVPEEVREAMAHDRMLRSWVLEFEMTPGGPLPDPPELSVASVATHDLERFVSFFEAPAQSAFRRAMGGDARRGLRVCLDQLAASPARLVVVDLEDLWLERARHNRPGTGPEAGNWRHRSARTLEDVVADHDTVTALRRVDDLRRIEEPG